MSVDEAKGILAVAPKATVAASSSVQNLLLMHLLKQWVPKNIQICQQTVLKKMRKQALLTYKHLQSWLTLKQQRE